MTAINQNVPSFGNRQQIKFSTGIRNASTTTSIFVGSIGHGVTIGPRSATNPTSGIYVYPGDLMADLSRPRNKRKLESFLTQINAGTIQLLWRPSQLTWAAGSGTGYDSGAAAGATNQLEVISVEVDASTYSTGTPTRVQSPVAPLVVGALGNYAPYVWNPAGATPGAPITAFTATYDKSDAQWNGIAAATGVTLRIANDTGNAYTVTYTATGTTFPNGDAAGQTMSALPTGATVTESGGVITIATEVSGSNGTTYYGVTVTDNITGLLTNVLLTIVVQA